MCVCVCVCDLTINSLKVLICNEIQPTNQPTYEIKNNIFIAGVGGHRQQLNFCLFFAFRSDIFSPLFIASNDSIISSLCFACTTVCFVTREMKPQPTRCYEIKQSIDLKINAVTILMDCPIF